MSAVDERVVKMRFDNATFKQEAANTQKALDNVNRAVDNSGKSKGLLNLGAQMDGVAVKASAMQVVAVTALGTIVNKAVDAGLRIAKSLTLDPLKQGFDEYELKMKSIQTILANTKGESLKTVSAALNDLNQYSDKTIYNFANMTENIGKMTTAGISLKDATATVKGFSNMAALAGGDANAAAGAMEQFAQGLQAGSIKAIDWMSLSNRGLGSQALQKAFYETAKAAGTLTDLPVGQTYEQWIKASGGFRGSLESGWLTTEVATDALKIMTGDVQSVQALMKQGFSRKTAKDMIEIANNALESATKVRTFSAFMGTLKEQVGSGFAQVFEQLIGNFNQATNLFSRMSAATGKTLGNIFNYITKVAQGWREMGGRAAILKTIKNILAPIGAILEVIAEAWTAAFGQREAGSGLASLSKGLRNITKPLQLLADLIRGSIGPITFVFRLFKIGSEIVKELAGFIGDLFEKLLGIVNLNVGGAGGGFLDFVKDLAKQIGDAVKKVSDLLDKGKSLKEAFGKVKFDFPDMPDFSLPSLPSLPSGNIGGGIDGDLPTGKFALMTAGIKGLTTQMGIFEGTSFDTSNITDGADSATSSLDKTQDKAASLGDKLGPFFSGLKDKIASFVDGMTFDDLMASFNLAVLSTFVISLARFFNTMSKSFEGFIGTGEAINGILDDVGNALKSFQTSARAKLILNIGIAIGILAASLWLLSTIPADKLAFALGALTGIAIILKVTMGALSDTIEKLDGKGINLKMLALGGSMVLFSISVLILASAMKKLSNVDWDGVAKAGIAMFGLVKAMEGLAAIKAEGILRTAFALVVVSAGLLLFAEAVEKFAGLDLDTFAEGMLYAATSLGALVFLLKGFQSSLGGAAAMVVVVGALWLLVDVIEKMASLSLATFGEGIGYIAASLLVLVLAMYGFQSSLAGAAALLVVTGALWVLVGVIEAFSNLDWGTFFKGLGMLAITLVTLTALMALMGVLSPLILAGAIAMGIFGAAIFLLGAGIALLAKGVAALILISGGVVAAISAFAVGAAIGIGVFLQTLALQAPIMKDSILKLMQTFFDGLVEGVPIIIDGIKRLWDAVMKELGGDKGGKGGGAKGAAMQATGKSWIEKLGDGVKKMIPDLVAKAVELGVKFLGELAKHAGEFGAKGALFVQNLLDGVASRIGGVVDAAVNLVVKFAEGLGNNLGKIVTAGIKLIGDFLHALAAGIRGASGVIGPGLADVLDAMKDVGVDLVKGLIEGVVSMTSEGLGAIGNLAGGMIDKAKDMFKIFSPSRVFKDIGKFVAQGLTQGIQDHAAAAIVAVASMVGGQIAVATEYISKFIQKLDQEALAATARATGLQKAAEAAAKAAEKTKKNKKDDQAAKALQRKADKATRRAERLEEQAEAAKERQERATQFEESSLIEKAKLRSEDAQNQMDDAKSAEFSAAAKLAEAQALREQAKKKGVSNKDAKKMRQQANELEKQARKQAQLADELIEKARLSARDALTYQKLAGDEAAALFQKQFDEEARADAEEEAYNKMTDAEKAVRRRQQAAELQAKANADLQKAKELAYTDLEAANELAQEAMDQADQARQYLVDAAALEEAVAQAAREGTGQSGQETGGTVVNLDPTTAASIAFGNYSDLFDAGVAAAAAGNTVEFNQYNSSPEALNPTDVYRHTNNQLAFAADKLQPAA